MTCMAKPDGMQETYVNLNFREKKLVWNREVLYQEYKNTIPGSIFIMAGNESGWIEEGRSSQFTPDFIICVSEFHVSYVVLKIYYGTPVAATILPADVPPHGLRYCVDGETIAVWNAVKRQYDIAKCSTGVCADGKCAPPPPPAGAECTEAAARETPCPEDPTKKKLETCIGGKWTVVEDPCSARSDIRTETLMIIAVLAVVTLIIILRGRK